MTIKDIEGKRWQELLLIQLKKTLKLHDEFKSIINILENINYRFNLHDIEEYIKAMDDKIHIPEWNKYPETNPDQLDVYSETYYVFFEPDFFVEARWNNGNFSTFNEFRESGNKWEIKTDMNYWLPITYPTPY